NADEECARIIKTKDEVESLLVKIRIRQAAIDRAEANLGAFARDLDIRTDDLTAKEADLAARAAFVTKQEESLIQKSDFIFHREQNLKAEYEDLNNQYRELATRENILYQKEEAHKRECSAYSGGENTKMAQIGNTDRESSHQNASVTKEGAEIKRTEAAQTQKGHNLNKRIQLFIQMEE